MRIITTISLLLISYFGYAQTQDIDTIIVGSNYVGSGEAIDNQQLTISDDTLYIENSNYVDLKPYLDNTDQQTLNFFSLDTATSLLYVGLLNGDTISVDLSDLQLIGLQEQLLSLVNDSLRISNGNYVDLSAYANTDSQNLGHTVDNDTLRTITISGGSSTQINVADRDNDPTNELYDDAPVYDSLAATNVRIDSNYAQILLRVLLPNPPCTSGELMKWNNISQKFECGSDLTVGEADGTLTNVDLVSRTLSFDVTQGSVDNVTFPNWDTLDTDDVLKTTAFGGDVTGPYDDLQIINNSHSHDTTSLPTFLTSVEGVTNDAGNIDLVAGSNIQIASSDAANTITISATVVTNLERVTADVDTFGVDAVTITSSSGTDVHFQGDAGAGLTPVLFRNSATPATTKVSVSETDPTVQSHIKSITTTDIARWNAFDSEAEIDSAVANNNYTGPQGPQGVQGIQGLKGDIPSHEWGTGGNAYKLRFQNPNGTWAAYSSSLKGEKGDMGASLLILDMVADSTALPVVGSYTGNFGDVYVTTNDGHAWVFKEDSPNRWMDIGQLLPNEVRSISMQYSGRSQPVTTTGESQALYIVGDEMAGRRVYEATFRFPNGPTAPTATIQILKNAVYFVSLPNVTDSQVYTVAANETLAYGDVLSINISAITGTFAGGITVTLSTVE